MAAADIFDSVTAATIAQRSLNQTMTAQDGQAFLLEVTRQGHQAKIDERQALALQEARMSAQSREVLQTQAALNAPRQTAPAYVPEAAALTTAK